jgi:hypothetical protein
VPIRARTFLILAALLLLAAALAGLMPGDAVARAMFQSSPLDIQFTATPTLFPTAPPYVMPPIETAFPTPVETPSPTPNPIPAIPTLDSHTPMPTTGASDGTDSPLSTATTVLQPEPLLAPTAAPLEATPEPVYLPPPTLTAPGAFALGHGLPQLTGPHTSSTEGQAGAATDPQAAPAPVAESAMAQLIDSLVSLLSYGWLCCGSSLLVLIAVGFVWLARRKPAG